MRLLTSLALVVFVATSCHGQTTIQQQDSPQQKNNSTLTENDHLQIAVRKICPVSGGELGSMGEPIKVKVGEQIAYLCCKSCQGKQIDKNHWESIQNRLAAAQAICPIMEKPVDATMKSTVVNGRQVFVCCPPCIPKIQADIKGSLAKVNASYVSYVARERQAKSDQLHAAAQGICPVMGEAVDASMKSTVVNGRKIFVCCPPCIEKIKADPAGYVAKLDAQIAGDAHEHHEGDGHDHAGHDQADHKHDK